MLLRALAAPFRPSSTALRLVRRARPVVEGLEDRTLPAVIVPLSGTLEANLAANVSGTVAGFGVSGPSSAQSGSLAATAIPLPDAGSSAPLTLDSIAIGGRIADNLGLFGTNPDAGSINGQTTVSVEAIVGQQATHGQQFSTAFEFLYDLSGSDSNLLLFNPLNLSATFRSQDLVFEVEPDPADGLPAGTPVVVNFNSKTSLSTLPVGVSLQSDVSITSGGVNVPIQNNGGLHPAAVFVTTVGSTLEVQASLDLSASGNIPQGSYSYARPALTLTLTATPATPTVSVTASGGSYTGKPYGAVASVNGYASLEGVSPTLTYYAGTFTSVDQLQGLTPLAAAPAAAGSYTALASFPGSADYLSASALGNFTITPAATASHIASLSSSAPSPHYGQAVTFRATVTAPHLRVAPRGSVEFFDGTTDLGAATFVSATRNTGVWTFTTSSLAAGSHSIQAVFTGDGSGDFGSCNSNVFSQMVNQATPVFTPSVPAATFGAAAVVVSGRLGTHTAVPAAGEMVSVTFNGVTQSAPLDGNGLFTTSFGPAPRAGLYTIHYAFGGDGNFTPATGRSVLTVHKATLTLGNLSAPTITDGTSSVSISGQLSSGTLVPPAGEVVLVTVGGVTHSAPIDPTGTFSASFASGTLRVGTHGIRFSYPGDADFNAVTGASTLTVLA
jgi:hypothetical protein